jgi:hypothetical protein
MLKTGEVGWLTIRCIEDRSDDMRVRMLTDAKSVTI